ncbi:MAG: Crp/Fnr family transcriptional regulator [Cyclobacteriaceae bacterium]
MYDLLFKYFQSKVNIDQDQFDVLAPQFKRFDTKRNEFLLRRGEICKYNYFVNEGCLRFFTTNKEGQQMTRYFAFPGKFGTSLASFIELEPSFEYIQSVEQSQILAISRQDFFELVDSNPVINKIYRDILEMAYITSQKRIYGLQGDTALDRLKWLMEYQPKILSKLSNKVIASYLGVTPYTLSRLKTEL